MGIAQHGPVHHPRDQEQCWRRSPVVCGQAVCGGIPACLSEEASGKGHWWDMNKSLVATAVNVLSCATGLGMIPAPAGADAACSLLKRTLGWCLRSTSAHWACCLEGQHSRGEGNCGFGEFLCSKQNLKCLVGTCWQQDDSQGNS